MGDKADKAEKAEKKLTKEILDFIRTTMRNNIDLTNIADNKANVLLSLNALMLTFLVPFVFPQLEFIQENNLYIPLAIIVITCFTTIYLSTLVLKPGNFNHNQDKLEKGKKVSPFFYGNFYKVDRDMFHDRIRSTFKDEDAFINNITDDLHSLGRRLGEKMTLLRIAFNVFIGGLFLSLVLAGIILFIF